MSGELVVRAGGAELVVADGRIAPGSAPTSAPGLDVPEGGLVVAGFVDLQCNGAGGIDLTAEPERVWEVAALLPRYGVTAWLPTIVSSPAEVTARALAALARRPGDLGPVAEPLGLHLEGPFLAPDQRGAHDARQLAVPASDGARADRWSRDAGVAMVTLAPELPGALDLARRLADEGVVVAAGHTGATSAEARAAADAGFTMVTHLFNGMRPLHHRAPGLAGAALADPRWRCGLICDGLHVDPEVVALAWAALGDRLVLVTDAVAAFGAPEGTALRLGDRAVTHSPEGGVRLPDGTLAGSDLAMDEAVRNLATFTGCTLGEAAAAASAAPAAVLGDGIRGRLGAGTRGDLVVLDADGQVVATIIAGTVAYRRSRG